MNFKVFIFIILLCFSFPSFAQKNWKQLLRTSPRTVINEAEVLSRQALETKNAPLFIQATILKAKGNIQINPAGYNQVVKDIDHAISISNDSITTSFLHLINAEVYKDYYQKNIADIQKITPVEDAAPQQLDKWSEDVFFKVISKHCTAAIQYKELLQNTSIEAYQSLLEKEYPNVLRPTLFGFMAHQCIELLTDMTTSQDLNNNHSFDKSALLLPLDSFLHVSFDNTEAIQNAIGFLYKELLLFKQKADNEAALLIADLGRLKYERFLLQPFSEADIDSTYLSRLQELKDKYNDIPEVIEVIAEEANYYLYLSKDGANDFYLKSLDLATEGIEKYPQYKNIFLLKDVIRDIRKPGIKIKLGNDVYPKKQEISVEYYNIGKLEMDVFRLNESAISLFEKENKQLPLDKEFVYNRVFFLNKDFTKQDTTLFINFPKSGLYVLEVKNPALHNNSLLLYVSPFHTSVIERDNLIEFFIRDAVSGKPEKDVRITLYTQDHTQKLIKSLELTTDKNGFVSFPASTFIGVIKKQSVYYETTSLKHPSGHLNVLNLYEKKQKDSIAHIELFTDRKIYRPEDWVYYKGIAYSTNHSQSLADSEMVFPIHLKDPNDNIVYTDDVKTNEWGSFSGKIPLPRKTLNGNFHVYAGKKRIADIQVTNYKTPEFKIVTEPIEDKIQIGDQVKIEGRIRPHADIYLPDIKVKYKIFLHQMSDSGPLKEIFEQGELPTDEKGNFTLDFTTKIPHKYKDYYHLYYDVRIDAYNHDGAYSSVSHHFPVGESFFYVDMQLPAHIDKNNGKPIFVKIWNYHTELEKHLKYGIYKLAPLANINDTYEHARLNISDTILEGYLNSKSDSIKPDFSTWSSGAYVLRIENETTDKDVIRRDSIFFVYSSEDKQPPVLTYNWFVPQKTICAPGENAEILLGTSARNVYVLYELFNNHKLLDRKQFKLSNRTMLLHIPFLNEYGNEVELSVSFVKDQKTFANYTHLLKKQESRHLNIKTTVFRDKITPGEYETWNFTVLDTNNKPVQAEVMAGMYDYSWDYMLANTWNFSPPPYILYQEDHWDTKYNTSGGIIKNHFSPRFFYHFPLTSNYFNLYGITPRTRMMNSFRGENAILFEQTKSFNPTAFTQKQFFNSFHNVYSGGKIQKNEIWGTGLNNSAFFYPNIYPDHNGNFSIRFEVPPHIGKWKFMLMAHTPDMKYGYWEKEVQSVKELMVTPHLPRFLREGDSCIIRLTVSNFSSTPLNGDLKLELLDPETKELILSNQTTFQVGEKQEAIEPISFIVPDGFRWVNCRVSATTTTFSDTEQQLLIVTPNEVALMETLPLVAASPGEHKFVMKPSTSKRKDHRLTLEMSSNLFWNIATSLPYTQEIGSMDNAIELSAAIYENAVGLAMEQLNYTVSKAILRQQENNPEASTKIEQERELKSTSAEITPWVEESKEQAERMIALKQFFNRERLTLSLQDKMEQLMATQNEDGSWGWFKGMDNCLFVTSNILINIAYASTDGKINTGHNFKDMLSNAVKYLDHCIEKEITAPTNNQAVSYAQLLYMFTRSLYKNVPLSDSTPYKNYLTVLRTKWDRLKLEEKALAALVLHRNGSTETAEKILESIRQYATVSEKEGMYWNYTFSPANRMQSAVIFHSILMEAFSEISFNERENNLMKLWLLQQKQAQNWGGTLNTVNAIHALLVHTDHQLIQKDEPLIAIGQQIVDTTKHALDPGYIKQSFSQKEIKPDMFHVTVTKKDPSLSWGTLHLQYFTPLKNVRENNTKAISIEKELFIEQLNEGKRVLLPINRSISTGNKIIIRFTIKTDRDMQYVHLKNFNTACFEPVNQFSGIMTQNDLTYYQDSKDVVTNFFFDNLPKGTHILEYPMWVTQGGTYQAGMAKIQCVYTPEFTAHSNSKTIKVDKFLFLNL